MSSDMEFLKLFLQQQRNKSLIYYIYHARTALVIIVNELGERGIERLGKGQTTTP